MSTPPATAVLLTPLRSGGSGVRLVADAAGLSEYHARVSLPASLPPGEYAVSVANEAEGSWHPASAE